MFALKSTFKVFARPSARYFSTEATVEAIAYENIIVEKKDGNVA